MHTLPSFAATHRTIKKKKKKKRRWCTPRADGPGGSAPVASFPLVIVLLLNFLPYPPETLNVYTPREPLASSYTKPPFQPYIRNPFFPFLLLLLLFFFFLSSFIFFSSPLDFSPFPCSEGTTRAHTREEKRSFDKGRFFFFLSSSSSSPRCQAAHRRDTTCCIERLVWPSTKTYTLFLFLFIFLLFFSLRRRSVLRPKRITHAIGRINEGEKKEFISKE